MTTGGMWLMNKTPRYFQPSLGTGAHPQLKLVIYHFKAESPGLKLGGADPRPAASNRPSACWRSRSDEGVRTGSSRRNGDAILRYLSWTLLTTDLQHEWGQGMTLVESYTHLEHVWLHAEYTNTALTRHQLCCISPYHTKYSLWGQQVSLTASLNFVLSIVKETGSCLLLWLHCTVRLQPVYCMKPCASEHTISPHLCALSNHPFLPH